MSSDLSFILSPSGIHILSFDRAFHFFFRVFASLFFVIFWSLFWWTAECWWKPTASWRWNLVEAAEKGSLSATSDEAWRFGNRSSRRSVGLDIMIPLCSVQTLPNSPCGAFSQEIHMVWTFHYYIIIIFGINWLQDVHSVGSINGFCCTNLSLPQTSSYQCQVIR